MQNCYMCPYTPPSEKCLGCEYFKLAMRETLGDIKDAKELVSEQDCMDGGVGSA